MVGWLGDGLFISCLALSTVPSGRASYFSLRLNMLKVLCLFARRNGREYGIPPEVRVLVCGNRGVGGPRRGQGRLVGQESILLQVTLSTAP